MQSRAAADTPAIATVRVVGAGAAVALASLAVYAATLAPSVGFIDSGELTVAAWEPGVAHPPGFPAYILLAHVATWLPVGSVALRVNAFSAVCMAFCVGLLAASAIRAVSREDSGESRAENGAAGRLLLAAIGGALLFAVLRTPWSYATIAEVYALSSFLVIVTWLLTVIWWRDAAGDARRRPCLDVAAGVFGVSLGVHPLSSLLIVPALGVLVWSRRRQHPLSPARILRLAAVSLVGFSVYLYLPIAARSEPLLNWGDPSTARDLWLHISGWQYRTSGPFSLAGVGAEWRMVLRAFAEQIAVWQLPLVIWWIVAGGVWLRRSNRSLFRAWLTWAAVAVIVPVVLGGFWVGNVRPESDDYVGADDKLAYYIPFFMALAVAWSIGLWRVMTAASRRGGPAAAVIAGILLFAAGPIAAAVTTYPSTNRRGDFVAREYAENGVRPVGPNGLLLTRDWELSSPLLYLQAVEGLRPDVTVLDLLMLQRSWYLEAAARRVPEVFSRVKPEADALAEVLDRIEAADDVLRLDQEVRTFTGRYLRFLERLVETQLPVGPVYVTSDVLFDTAGHDLGFAKRLTDLYEPVPQGIVFELVRDRTRYYPPVNTPVVLDHALRPRRRLGPRDLELRRILPVYRDMLFNRAEYLERWGKLQEAHDAYASTLAFDTAFAPAQEALRRLAPVINRRQ